MDVILPIILIVVLYVIISIGIIYWKTQKENSAELKFDHKLKKHQDFLNSTPCDSITVEQFKQMFTELVGLNPPSHSECRQVNWFKCIAQYDYAITWYNKTIGQNSKLTYND